MWISEFSGAVGNLVESVMCIHVVSSKVQTEKVQSCKENVYIQKVSGTLS